MNDLGKKIKKFREEKGVSQLKLETTICTSSGRISKIENGKINPDKETIIDIAKALNLTTSQIASLFGIEVLNYKHLESDLEELLIASSFVETVNKVINDLIFKLGYIASVLFLNQVNSDTVITIGITKSNISNKVLQNIDCCLEELKLSKSKDRNNFVIKSLLNQKILHTYNTRDYIVPMVTKEKADFLQKITGDKSNLIVPLIVRGECIGIITYIKKYSEDFGKEVKILEQVSKYIAIALYNSLHYPKNKSKDLQKLSL